MTDKYVVNADFPKRLRPLFERHRYKVFFGGRGSGKSWGAARALLIQGANRRLRILCTREVQKSIKDSVHKLLTDQIEALGLGAMYEVTREGIRGLNGTEFLFAGLSDMTSHSLKSYEGVDIVWVEEAQTVNDKSWEILTPTIRKPDSEIWITFNPDLDTDPTWVRFVENPPADSVVVEINYWDNPWFPDVLEDERAHAEATLPKEDYENIWEGVPRPAAKGAIYAAEVAEAVREDRICQVPYDPRLKVHAVWDMGFNDAMAIILVQRKRTAVNVIGYMEGRFQKTDWYAAELQKLNLNWGKMWLPHDAYHNDRRGDSDADIIRNFGFNVPQAKDAVPNVGVEQGIRSARVMFPMVYFDRAKTERLVECLKRYRRRENPYGAMGNPIHDEYSNGADAWRYLSLVVNRLDNAKDEAPMPVQQFVPYDASMGY